MTDEDRQFIISSIKYASGQGKPIVILHGTDTMQDTAELCALSWKPSVPVVFTGAMKPLGFEDSDAIQNVTEAMMVAKIIQPGVYISFHNRLFEVPGARKNKVKRTFEAY